MHYKKTHAERNKEVRACYRYTPLAVRVFKFSTPSYVAATRICILMPRKLFPKLTDIRN
jgi:hypothetical protein